MLIYSTYLCRLRRITDVPYSWGFRGHLFSRISRISASRKNIFRKILGATPSSRSMPTWVWSGFGLITKIFFPLAICETPLLYGIYSRSPKRNGTTSFFVHLLQTLFTFKQPSKDKQTRACYFPLDDFNVLMLTAYKFVKGGRNGAGRRCLAEEFRN